MIGHGREREVLFLSRNNLAKPDSKKFMGQKMRMESHYKGV